MIERLETLPAETMVEGIATPHSYRGYYCDLAFERGETRITASAALALRKGAMGEIFEGYKGGDFQMGRNTPLWLSDYGTTGQKIMGLRDDGSIELANDD